MTEDTKKFVTFFYAVLRFFYWALKKYFAILIFMINSKALLQNENTAPSTTV